MILQSELKQQRKLVRSLKKKSLWSKNLEEVYDYEPWLHLLKSYTVTSVDLIERFHVYQLFINTFYASINNFIASFT